MEPLISGMPGALVELLRGAPLSQGKVAFAWRAAVGSAVERATAVRLEDGVLIVETAGAPWSRELQRSSATILRRLETLLGPGVVQRIQMRTV
jgi:predicted nucleic acid-binding Zn ribbon protein